MNATVRLLALSLCTALQFGVMSAYAPSEAEAVTTSRTYLPESPYAERRRAQQSGSTLTRSRLPSPQTLYQDSPLIQQSPTGLVMEPPVVLDEPMPLEVTPLYPQRGITAPQQIDPISADEFASPAPLAAPTPIDTIEPIPSPSISGMPDLPPPPAAFSALGANTPPPPPLEPMPASSNKREAESLWEFLTEEDTPPSAPARTIAAIEPIPTQIEPIPTASQPFTAEGELLLPPPPPPPDFRVQADPAPAVPAAPFANPKKMAQPQPAIVNLDISAQPSAQMPEPIRSPHNALSAESRTMISEIPEDLTPELEPTKKVKVARIDPDIVNILQAGEDSGMRTDSGSIGVKVRKPNFDVNYELEKAYQAVLGGNIEEAVGIYKEALSIAPRNKTGLFGLATTYHRIGSLDNARALYARLLEIDPDHREGLNNFLALVAEESPEDALPELQVLASKHPGFSPILAQLGLLYHQLGDFGKAREHLLSAVRISPENMTYRYNLAILLDEQGAYAEAANVYRYLIGVSERGVTIPASADALQARLTYILSQIS